jgi:WD40 repeat protein
VLSVAFSPDGQWLATGSDDYLRGEFARFAGDVCLWDTASGVQLLRLSGHRGSVWGVAFSPDGSRLASGSSDATVRVWGPPAAPEPPSSFSASLRSARLEAKAAKEVFAHKKRKKWDVAGGGAELACLRGHKGLVACVAFSPDSQRLASGSADYNVRLWDTATGDRLVCLCRHKVSVRCVAFSPDGTRLVSGSADSIVRVWDAAGGTELACLRGHEKSVTSVAFSPDGTRVASASDDKTVRVWDASNGECLEILEGIGDVSAIARTTSRGTGWIALARGSETVILPASTRAPVAWFPEALDHLATHPAGCAWAGSRARHLYLLELETPRSTREVAPQPEQRHANNSGVPPSVMGTGRAPS